MIAREVIKLDIVAHGLGVSQHKIKWNVTWPRIVMAMEVESRLRMGRPRRQGSGCRWRGVRENDVTRDAWR